ncbi:MAG: class I SAM-dependent methyltransferase, partial [Hyphomicrobiales bacterium]
MQDTATVNDDGRFAFGENWSDYARGIGDEAIREAEAGLLRMLECEEVAGRSWLDIGCGSGVHAVAALGLGASPLVAVDYDVNSVETARAVLEAHAPGRDWTVRRGDVLKMTPQADGQHDIVYSWGVLHHTGDLAGAMSRACDLVAPGGLLAVALYRRTRLDRFWIAEKRWYASASPRAQAAARRVYLAALAAGLTLTGRSWRNYRDSYRQRRGMSLVHDVHDWLGGYPYEAISADEVRQFFEARG